MKDKMDISSENLERLFILGIILGIGLTIFVDQEVIMMIMALSADVDVPPHDVYILNFEKGECNFVKPELYLPASEPHPENHRSYECTELYQSYVMEQKIDIINQSTKKEEIRTILKNASEKLENSNPDDAKIILNQISSKRTYFIEE